jgi:hypothetical protein
VRKGRTESKPFDNFFSINTSTSTLQELQVNGLAILRIERTLLLDEIGIDTIVTNLHPQMLEKAFEVIYVNCFYLNICHTESLL